MDIKSYLIKTGMTQIQFAALIGVTQAYVSKWWLNQRQPSEEMAALIELRTAGMIRVEDLRPDRTWHRDAAGKPIAFTVQLAAA